MANYNNRFLNEKDKNKRKNEASSFYSDQITSMMKEKLAWTPTDYGETSSGFGSLSRDEKVASPPATPLPIETKIPELPKRTEIFSKEREAEIRKNSNNPYIRMGKHDLNTYEEDKARREAMYDEKYPIIRQSRALMDNPIVNNTVKPFVEGVINTAGETIGEVATVGNKDGKENLRRYLDERDKAQSGLEKIAYKTGEIGSNIALMSGITPKIPGLNKLGNLTGNKYVNAALREGAENVILEGGLDLVKGDTEDYWKNRVKDMAGGAVFGVGMEGVGSIVKGISNKIAKPQNIPYNPSKIPDLPSNAINEVPKVELPDVPKGIEIKNPKGKLNPVIEGYKLKDTDIHVKERDFMNVGDKKVNAMGYEHPELRPYIEGEAHALKGELERTVKGGTGQLKDENGIIVGGVNNARVTSQDIARLKDSTGASYKELEKAIDDVIEDGGKENHALAKRVELMIDDRLSNGYKDDIFGENIPSIPEYKQVKEFAYSEPQNMSKIPKMEERERIQQQFNDMYGNTSNIEPQNTFNADKELIDDGVIMTSQNLDLESKRGSQNEKIEMVQPREYNPNPTEKVSKMRSNTFENSPLLQDEASRKVVEDISGIYETKPNQQSFERAKAELETNYDDVVKRIKENGIQSAEDTVAAGLVTKQLVEDMKKTGEGKALKEWLEHTRSEATNLGQAVQAISTWKKMTPEGMLLNAQRIIDFSNDKLKETNPKEFAKKMKDNTLSELTDEEMKFIVDKMTNINEIDVNGKADDILKTLDIPDKITKKWNKLTDKEKLERAKDIELARVLQVVANKADPTVKDKLLAMQRINLLGNTKTQSRNILGNVIMGGLESAKDTIATPIDKLLSKKTGVRTTSYSNPLDKAKGMKKGLREAVEDFRLNIDTSNMGGRYSEKEMMNLPGTQGFRKIENPKGFKDRLNNVMAGSEKLTGAVLGMGDRPFFEGAFNDSIQQQLRANKASEPTEEMIKRALEVAEEQTFQNVSTMTKGFKMLQRGLNLGKDVGLGTIAMPYVKTPANILDKAIDYSPIGGLRGVTNLINGLKKGNLDQKKVVDQLGRGLTGSTLIGLGYKLANDGVLQGSGADDKDARALEQQIGKMPYSIKVGDTYNTIDWAQPAAIPLMIGADIAQKGGKDKDLGKVIFNAIKSGGATLFNQSLLTGLADLFSGYGFDAGENFMGGLENTAYNMLSQAVPFGSALNQVNSFVDKNVRNTYDGNRAKQEVNTIQNKIPGLSKDLAKKYDTVGREVKKNNGAEGAKYLFDSLLNPGKTKKYNPSPAEKLAMDIYESTGETIHIPQVSDKKINYKETKDGVKKSLELDAKDRSELQRIMGEKTEEAFAKKASERSFQNKEDYKKAQELQKIMQDIKKESEHELLEQKGLRYYKDKKKK